jgi:adenylate cyclase
MRAHRIWLCSATHPVGFDVSLCERALQIDPRNAFALGGMAWNSVAPIMSAKPPDTHTQEAIKRADEFVTQSIAADPNQYPVYALKAWLLIPQKRPEEAISAAEHSLALNPSNVWAYHPLGDATALLGHPERAVEIADEAIRLSPRDPELPGFYFAKTWTYFMMQQDVQMMEWARRALAAQKQEVWSIPRLYLAAALALNGSETEAREIIKHYLSLPGVEITSIRAFAAWLYLWSDTPTYSAFVKRLSEGLRRAGMPEE